MFSLINLFFLFVSIKEGVSQYSNLPNEDKFENKFPIMKRAPPPKPRRANISDWGVGQTVVIQCGDGGSWAFSRTNLPWLVTTNTTDLLGEFEIYDESFNETLKTPDCNFTINEDQNGISVVGIFKNGTSFLAFKPSSTFCFSGTFFYWNRINNTSDEIKVISESMGRARGSTRANTRVTVIDVPLDKTKWYKKAWGVDVKFNEKGELVTEEKPTVDPSVNVNSNETLQCLEWFEMILKEVIKSINKTDCTTTIKPTSTVNKDTCTTTDAKDQLDSKHKTSNITHCPTLQPTPTCTGNNGTLHPSHIRQANYGQKLLIPWSMTLISVFVFLV